jgi:hypothetical protein
VNGRHTVRRPREMVPVIFAKPVKDMATKAEELFLVTEETEGRGDFCEGNGCLTQITEIPGSVASPDLGIDRDEIDSYYRQTYCLIK